MLIRIIRIEEILTTTKKDENFLFKFKALALSFIIFSIFFTNNLMFSISITGLGAFLISSIIAIDILEV